MVYQAVVRSTLLYGCETWHVPETGERMLEVWQLQHPLKSIHEPQRLRAIGGLLRRL